MSVPELRTVLGQWTRLGILFSVAEAVRTPDIEELLLDTARIAPQRANLVECATTWLVLRGEYVCKHRLAALIREDLEQEHHPTMGLMLETAQAFGAGSSSRFAGAIEVCHRADEERPLMEVEQRNSVFAGLARARATDISRKWGRWFAAFPLREDVIRPAWWIARRNPSLAMRALVGGDLVASILAEHEAVAGGFASEMELARRCGVTRMAVRHAVDRLEMAGMATRRREGRGMRIEIHALARA